MTGAVVAGDTADYDARRTACPLCNSARLRHRLTDLRGHRIDRCGDCGVEFMNPQYSDAHLRNFYAGYINLHPGGGGGKPSHRSDPAVRTAGKTRAIELLGRFAPGRRILMVGCGDGLELEIGRRLGWQVEGYDVDAATTASVAARHGVTVHCGDFPTLAERVAPFDAVFLDQVIEHPKDPAAYLRACRALLRPGGVLFLGTPNIGSISNRLKTAADRARLRRRPGRHYNTRHHLFFFTPGVLGRLLRQRFGFEVLATGVSPKPQRNPLTAVFGRFLPSLDSSFLLIARRPRAAQGAAAAAAAR